MDLRKIAQPEGAAPRFLLDRQQGNPPLSFFHGLVCSSESGIRDPQCAMDALVAGCCSNFALEDDAGTIEISSCFRMCSPEFLKVSQKQDRGAKDKLIVYSCALDSHDGSFGSGIIFSHERDGVINCIE